MANAVTGKAVTYCIFGSRPSILIVPDGHNIKLNGENRANVADRIPIVNIVPFGLCASPFNPGFIATSLPVPCIPLTPAHWYEGDKTVIIDGDRSMDDTSLNLCIWRGVIAILYAGQGAWNVADTVPDKMKSKAEEKLNSSMDKFAESEQGKKMVKAVDEFKETDDGKKFLNVMNEAKDSNDTGKMTDAVSSVSKTEAGKKLIAAVSAG
ncbi:MAG TPA: DUF4280 domain-containing protein [Victivallales bacterium]|nr:DUF4280 domain-containing protein [Victivallales bacterium]